MDSLLTMVKRIEKGECVSVSGKEFDKDLLSQLIKDIDKSKELFNDRECQNLIEMYYLYKKEAKLITSENVLLTFIMGFGGGVLIAALIIIFENLIFNI